MRYKIGEAAQLLGTSVRALRHLDTTGVLSPQYRDENGYRYYSSSDIEKLSHINLLQLAGFTLREIPALLEKEDIRQEFATHARMLKNKGRYLMLLGELVEETVGDVSRRQAKTNLERFRARLDAMSEEFHGDAPENAEGHDSHAEILSLLRTFTKLDERSYSNYKKLIDAVPMLTNEAYFTTFMLMIRMYKSGAFRLDELDTVEKNFLKVRKLLESDIV